MQFANTTNGGTRVDDLRVWLRRTGSHCKVRVEDRATADRLRDRLSPDFPLVGDPRPVVGARQVVFHVALDSAASFAELERAIGEIPGARLMLEPA